MPNSLLTRILRKLNFHRTTQAYFVGYPKTGNTWARFMLGRYVQLACSLSEIPLFDATDSIGRCERYCVGPSMHFTHHPLTWVDQTAGDLTVGNTVRPFLRKRVVLIVRHPLDAIASNWFQERHRSTQKFDGSLASFLQHPVFGLEKCLRFHRLWAEGAHSVAAFHLLRYEDMRTDPDASFTGLLHFLGITIDAGILGSAIDFAQFDNMKKLESSGRAPQYRSSGLDVFATGDRHNPDAYHVRRGKIGGYADYLDAPAREEFEALVAREMGAFFGYAGAAGEATHVR